MRDIVTLRYVSKFTGYLVRRRYLLPEQSDTFEKKCEELIDRKIQYQIHFEQEEAT